MEDDWLISSMKRYDQLFMYDVSSPIKGFDWTKDHSGLWVYSTYDNGRTELNLLQLPEKIVKNSLDGHRDFKIVSGALTPARVSCIRTLNERVLAVGNAQKGSVSFWSRNIELSEDLLTEQDHFIIRPELSDTSSLSLNNGITGIELMTNPDEMLTIQGTMGLITQSDINKKQLKWETNMGDCIHGVSFNDSNILLVCSGKDGKLSTCDLRQSPAISLTNNLPVSIPPIAFYANNETVAITFSNSLLRLYDTRSLDSPFATVTISCDHKSEELPCIKIASLDKGKISISGYKTGVEIYDSSNWSNYVKDPIPIFVHDGHDEEAYSNVTRILAHDWHHFNDRMLISTATDGSLHAWQFNVC